LRSTTSPVTAYQPAARSADGQCTRPRRHCVLRGAVGGPVDFDDLQGENKYSGQHAYNASRLAKVMFTYDLARRLLGTGVTANVLHPGVVRTAFGTEARHGRDAARIIAL